MEGRDSIISYPYFDSKDCCSYTFCNDDLFQCHNVWAFSPIQEIENLYFANRRDGELCRKRRGKEAMEVLERMKKEERSSPTIYDQGFRQDRIAYPFFLFRHSNFLQSKYFPCLLFSCFVHFPVSFRFRGG